MYQPVCHQTADVHELDGCISLVADTDRSAHQSRPIRDELAADRKKSLRTTVDRPVRSGFQVVGFPG
jgi:hypothetical protein